MFFPSHAFCHSFAACGRIRTQEWVRLIFFAFRTFLTFLAQRAPFGAFPHLSYFMSLLD